MRWGQAAEEVLGVRLVPLGGLVLGIDARLVGPVGSIGGEISPESVPQGGQRIHLRLVPRHGGGEAAGQWIDRTLETLTDLHGFGLRCFVVLVVLRTPPENFNFLVSVYVQWI